MPDVKLLRERERETGGIRQETETSMKVFKEGIESKRAVVLLITMICTIEFKEGQNNNENP